MSTCWKDIEQSYNFRVIVLLRFCFYVSLNDIEQILHRNDETDEQLTAAFKIHYS
jgi:hypothetical protein